MTETDIVDQVYRSGDFASREQAEEVTYATLRNLGRCLSAGEARDIAEFLPPDLSEALVDVGRASEPMTYEAFLERVDAEVDLEERDVERSIRAVVAVLAGRVGEEELENAQAQLPPNYGRLFDVKPAAVGRPFVDLVAARGTFDPAVDVETVTRAILQTLGERLSRGEAEDVGRYLEGEAESWLTTQDSPDAATFSVDEFVGRVARRADISEEIARESIRTVADVLADVVPPQELTRAVEQLPSDFDSLFAFDE